MKKMASTSGGRTALHASREPEPEDKQKKREVDPDLGPGYPAERNRPTRHDR
jgi:hypothetical protein